MKTIGLLGGMSFESTATYYNVINTLVNRRLGGVHSAKLLLSSVDFAEVVHYQQNDDWAKSASLLGTEAKKLEQAGADFILICTNTMHKVADEVQSHISVPLLHIADTTIATLQQAQMTKVGLLGTRYTMEKDFYKERLRQAAIEVVVPSPDDITIINDIIFNELAIGTISPQSKAQYLTIIDKLAAQGVQGIILGCTEIGLLIKQDDVGLPLFDTALIHSTAAVEASLDND